LCHQHHRLDNLWPRVASQQDEPGPPFEHHVAAAPEPARGRDLLKQHRIHRLDQCQHCQHSRIRGRGERQVESRTRRIERQHTPARVHDRQAAPRSPRARHERHRLHLAHHHLECRGKPAHHARRRDARQPFDPIGEAARIVEHARLRRQPQRRDHGIGREVLHADELHLPHAEER